MIPEDNENFHVKTADTQIPQSKISDEVQKPAQPEVQPIYVEDLTIHHKTENKENHVKFAKRDSHTASFKEAQEDNSSGEKLLNKSGTNYNYRSEGHLKTGDKEKDTWIHPSTTPPPSNRSSTTPTKGEDHTDPVSNRKPTMSTTPPPPKMKKHPKPLISKPGLFIYTIATFIAIGETLKNDDFINNQEKLKKEDWQQYISDGTFLHKNRLSALCQNPENFICPLHQCPS